MRVLAAIHSPHQDDVIEKILRHRGQWDPPWTRQRRARAPPPQREAFSTVLDEDFSQIPPQEEEDVSQDLRGDGPR